MITQENNQQKRQDNQQQTCASIYSAQNGAPFVFPFEPIPQFYATQQKVAVQVPILMENGQTIFHTAYIPLEVLADRMPNLVQPQMQVFPQMTTQVCFIWYFFAFSRINANKCFTSKQMDTIITPNNRTQPAQMASTNQLQCKIFRIFELNYLQMLTFLMKFCFAFCIFQCWTNRWI